MINNFFINIFKRLKFHHLLLISLTFMLSLTYFIITAVKVLIKAEGTAKIFFVPVEANVPPNAAYSLNIDTGTSNLSFVRVDVIYDPLKVQLIEEVQTTDKLKRIAVKTPYSEANTTGRMTLALGFDPTDKSTIVASGIFEVAKFTFTAVTAQTNQTASLTIDESLVEVVDENASNLVFTTTAAKFTINTERSPALVTETLTIPVSEDASIYSAYPNNKYGTLAYLETDNSPVKNILLKFNVTGINSRSVIASKLRIYGKDASGYGGDFHKALDNNWSESTVTWNTAPVADTDVLGSLGPVTVNTWYDVNVSPAISADGTYSFRITSTSSDGADYVAKEGANDLLPYLIITVPVEPNATSNPSFTPVISPSPTITSTETVVAIADTYVAADKATTNFGSSKGLYIDGKPVKISYIKFDLSPFAGRTLLSAKLQIRTTSGIFSGSPNSQIVKVVNDTNWNELTLNYNSRPALSAVLGNITKTASNTIYQVTLDPQVLQPKFGGLFSLGIDSTGGDAMYFNSRETTEKPQLILTFSQ